METMTDDASNPYAPPQFESVPLTDERILYRIPASRGSRFIANLIDSLIVSIPIVILTIVAFLGIDAIDESRNVLDLLVSTPGSWLLVFAYIPVTLFLFIAVQGYFVFTRAQTLGKMALSIVVVDHETWEPVSGWRYIARRELPIYLLNLIPRVGNFIVLVDALMIFGSQRRCLHDRIAGTSVMKRL